MFHDIRNSSSFPITMQNIITRNNSHCIYRILEGAKTRELFLTVVPTSNAVCKNEFQGHGQAVPDCAEQVRSVLDQVKTVLETERFAGSVFIQNVFMADISKRQLVRKIMYDFYGEASPATTYVAQPPCCGSEIAVELYATTVDDPTLKRERFCDKKVKVEYDGLSWLFLGDCVPAELTLGSYERSLEAFRKMESELKQSGFDVEQFFRVWLYQGHLVLPENDTQRYKELNRARTDFFRGRKFLAPLLSKDYAGPEVYPASTGIGTEDMDIVMSGIALSTKRADIIAVPLENPQQTSAFDYGEVYSPQSPKFARAMGLQIGDSAKVYVSGTAGITESESRYFDDPEGQTELTLDNIAALISGRNLEKHGIHGFDADLSDLMVGKVYVKRAAEYERIRSICEKRCPDIPFIYTIADVCRPELLVEIEGIAAAKRAGR